VALYQQGDHGQPVRDIQDRLAALGYPADPDPETLFGEGTRRAVEEFQRSRNLPTSGMVDQETWRTLVDAGFRLGDRILYYRLPMLHGEDVATLQRDLNALGFETGNVDGIFGPQTLRGVMDFQQNRRLVEDGIAGSAVVSELTLMVRATQKMGRETVRERVWLEARPPSLAGQRVVLDAFCRDDLEAEVSWEAAAESAAAVRDRGGIPVLSRSRDTRPDERIRARQANRMAADLVVSFALPRTDTPGIFYFESTLSRSEAGRSLAGFLSGRLGVEPVGRAMPILKETRALAVIVVVPRLDAALGRAVARALETWFARRAEDQPASDL
jgi:N-acetylmuramoyl-L-alanine amidase